MKELYSEIEIQASDERVWKVLTDFASFPQWNPFIRRVIGEAQEGQRLKVYIQPSGADSITFRPTILKVEPNRELRWLAGLKRKSRNNKGIIQAWQIVHIKT